MAAFTDHFRVLSAETRDAVPGATTAERLGAIPQALADARGWLVRPVSPAEVHPVVFPMDPHVDALWEPCKPGCRMCQLLQEHRQAHLQSPTSTACPEWTPHIHTSTTPGA